VALVAVYVEMVDDDGGAGTITDVVDTAVGCSETEGALGRRCFGEVSCMDTVILGAVDGVSLTFVALSSNRLAIESMDALVYAN
jgi:hypothetical protein